MAFPTSSCTIFRTTVTKLFGLGMTFSLPQTRILDGGRESKGRGRSDCAVTASFDEFGDSRIRSHASAGVDSA